MNSNIWGQWCGILKMSKPGKNPPQKIAEQVEDKEPDKSQFKFIVQEVQREDPSVSGDRQCMCSCKKGWLVFPETNHLVEIHRCRILELMWQRDDGGREEERRKRESEPYHEVKCHGEEIARHTQDYKSGRS